MSSHLPPHISFIIPVAKDSAAYRRCLKALAQLSPDRVELILYVDGPGEVPFPGQLAFPVSIHRGDTRRGPAYARNQAAQYARGDWLCFLDADVSVPPDFVWQVMDLPIRFPGYDAFIGSYDDSPGDPGLVSQYRNLLHHYVHQQSAEEASTFWGACGMIRRELFQAVGGFDTRYPEPSVEDIELGYRLTIAGHRNRLVKDWQVRHEKRWTLTTMVMTDVFRRALPWLALLRRYPLWGQKDLNLNRQSRLSGGATSLALLGFLLGLWWPPLTLLALGLLGGVVALNQAFYRFLYRTHSLRLALLGIPLHLLYYAYSSAAVAWDGATMLFSRNKHLPPVGSTLFSYPDFSHAPPTQPLLFPTRKAPSAPSRLQPASSDHRSRACRADSRF